MFGELMILCAIIVITHGIGLWFVLWVVDWMAKRETERMKWNDRSMERDNA